MISKEEIFRIATEHTLQVPIDHKNIPPEEQEHFAGAAGFLVSAKGEVRDLSVPLFIEAERKVSNK